MAAIVLTHNLVLAKFYNGITSNEGQICYQTFTRGITPTVSDTAAGFFAGALANSLTYEPWKPATLPATVTYDFGEQRLIDYIAVGAHTIGSSQAVIGFEFSVDGVSWTPLTQSEPESDHPIMVFFTAQQVRYIRLTVDGVGAPQIAVVYCGRRLTMQRGLYGGHSPTTLSRNVQTYPQGSESGQSLGHSIVNRGFKSSASWQHLSADWYRDNFDPFVYSCLRYPFFFAWRPLQYPDEVALCKPDPGIKPTNMGIRDFMEVSINLNAFGVDA